MLLHWPGAWTWCLSSSKTRASIPRTSCWAHAPIFDRTRYRDWGLEILHDCQPEHRFANRAHAARSQDRAAIYASEGLISSPDQYYPKRSPNMSVAFAAPRVAVARPACARPSVAAKAKAGNWLPGSDSPAHLDGSLAGDFGFDPLNLVRAFAHIALWTLLFARQPRFPMTWVLDRLRLIVRRTD